MCLIVQFNGWLFNVVVLIPYPKFYFHRLFMMKLLVDHFIYRRMSGDLKLIRI